MTTIETILNRIFLLLKEILTPSIVYQNWDKAPGNYMTFSYYTGISGGMNPSGEANLYQVKYYDMGGTLFLTQTYTYSISNIVLSVTAS